MNKRIAFTFLFIIGIPVLARSGDSGDEDFKFAKSLMMGRHEYDLAARKFSEFVQKYPKHIEAAQALWSMGYCYANLQKDEDAAEAYMRLIREYPGAEEKFRQEAMKYGGDAFLKLKKYPKAAEMYGMLLNQYPLSPLAEDALFWKGEAYSRQAREKSDAGQADQAKSMYEQSLTTFEDFLKRYPESKNVPAALAGAGFACYDRGGYQAATEYFSRTVSEFPADARAEECQLYLAECYYRMNRYPEARAAYARLLQLFPKGAYIADARSGMAWCDHVGGDMAAAAKGFAEAAKLAGDDRVRALNAWYDAGCAFHEAGDFASSVKALQIVAEDGEHPLRGSALFKLGAFKLEQAMATGAMNEERKKITLDAVENLKKALLNPNLGDEAEEANTFLGEAYLDLNDYASASVVFNEIVKRWPKGNRAPWALYHLALSYQESNQMEMAADTIRQLVSNYPDSHLRLKAAYVMAKCQAALGNVDKCRLAYKWIALSGEKWASGWRDANGQPDPALVEKAQEFAADSFFSIGESYSPKTEGAEAAVYYRQVLEKYSKSKQAGMALLRLGELAESSGKTSEAKKYYQSVLERGEQDIAYKHALYGLGVMEIQSGVKEPDPAAKQALYNSARKYFDAFIKVYQRDPLTPKAVYYRAEALYALNLKQDALKDYQASYDADPKGDLADAVLLGLAWCRRDLAQELAGKAARAVNEAERKKLDEVAGKLREASSDAFRELVEQYPNSLCRAEALNVLAVDLHEKKQFDQALAAVEEVLAKYGNTPFAIRSRIEKGRILDDMGRKSEAIAAFDNLLKEKISKDETAQAQYGLSWAWWGVAEPKLKIAAEAEKKYRDALGGVEWENLTPPRQQALQPLKSDWEKKLAGARADENHMVEALTVITRNHPDFAQVGMAWLRLGEVSYERGDYPQATVAYGKALELGKDGGAVGDKAQFRLAWCYLHEASALEKQATGSGRIEAFAPEIDKKRRAAMDAFEKVTTDYPASNLVGESYFRAAEIRREAKDYTGAITQYRRAMQSSSQTLFARAAAYGVGAALLESGQARNALDEFKKFLSQYADGEFVHEANWGAGQACFNQEAYADAVTYFEKSLANDYNGEAAAKARFGLGMIAFQQKNWEAAREEFLKVEAFHSGWEKWTALALFRSSQAAEMLGQKDKAKKDLEHILARYGNTDTAEKAKKRLAEMGG
jgi:TolA-binding protein